MKSWRSERWSECDLSVLERNRFWVVSDAYGIWYCESRLECSTSLLRSVLNFKPKIRSFFWCPKLFPRFCSLWRRMIQLAHYHLPPPLPIYICHKSLKRHMQASHVIQHCQSRQSAWNSRQTLDWTADITELLLSAPDLLLPTSSSLPRSMLSLHSMLRSLVPSHYVLHRSLPFIRVLIATSVSKCIVCLPLTLTLKHWAMLMAVTAKASSRP